MKIRQLISVALAALLLISCSKTESGENPGKKAGTSKLTISLKGEKSAAAAGALAPGSKASGTPTELEEGTINDFIVYVFKSDGSNDIEPKAVTVNDPGTDLTVVDLEITTDATEVYVVANTASTATTQTALMAVTKKSELQVVTGRLFAGTTLGSTSSQLKNNLWMSGRADVNPDYGGKVTASVTLSYIAARLRITSVTISDENLTDLSTDLVLNEITVLNAGGASKLIPAKDETSLIPSFTASASEPFYIAGMDMTDQSNIPGVYGQNNALKLALTGGNSAKIDATNNPNYFYLFENNGIAFEGEPTIITLKATYKGTREVYYSVLFKADPDGTLGLDNQIIERGNSYDIAMTIKKLGNSEPSLPALKTLVDITITPATWAAKIINKVYE